MGTGISFREKILSRPEGQFGILHCMHPRFLRVGIDDFRGHAVENQKLLNPVQSKIVQSPVTLFYSSFKFFEPVVTNGNLGADNGIIPLVNLDQMIFRKHGQEGV